MLYIYIYINTTFRHQFADLCNRNDNCHSTSDIYHGQITVVQRSVNVRPNTLCRNPNWIITAVAFFFYQ